MGVLIEGAWRDDELPQETGAGGEFRRADSRFRDRITADGSADRYPSVCSGNRATNPRKIDTFLHFLSLHLRRPVPVSGHQK